MGDETNRIREQVLALRCQAGDDRAFEELVGAFHERLRSYVARVLGLADAADDVLQDVWLDVYRGIPRLRNVRGLRSWLYRIARGRAALHLRRRKAWSFEPLAAEDAIDDAHGEPACSPEEIERLNRCLDALAPPHREALVLRFMEDMTYEEIATATGCELGTVRSRLHYAKRALREIIERSEP